MYGRQIHHFSLHSSASTEPQVVYTTEKILEIPFFLLPQMYRSFHYCAFFYNLGKWEKMVWIDLINTEVPHLFMENGMNWPYKSSFLRDDQEHLMKKWTLWWSSRNIRKTQDIFGVFPHVIQEYPWNIFSIQILKCVFTVCRWFPKLVFLAQAFNQVWGKIIGFCMQGNLVIS